MKVSIITVCFNAYEDLKKTMDSILLIDYIDFEYIIIDGGSLDGTKELLDKYSHYFQEKQIKFQYISEKDKGTYDAMNKGVLISKGDWINFMNAGDSFYSSNILSELFSQTIDKKVGVLYGDTFQYYDFGSGIAQEKDYLKDSKTMPFCHQSSFVKKELLLKYPFDLSYRIIADHNFFHQLRTANIKFQYIPIVISRYNGQYGLSATHPLLLHKERLRVHHITEKWYYPFSIIWVYLRYGWVQPFKKHMPKWITNTWMKYKRKYIKKQY